MELLRTTFLMGKYELARSLIYQLPASTLAGVESSLLHVAADVADSGQAAQMAVQFGYGRLIGSPARAYNNETPLHVAVRRGNLHGFRVLLTVVAENTVTQSTVDECCVLAATFGQHQILAELLQKTKPTDLAIQTAVLEAGKLQHVRPCHVLLETHSQIVAAALPLLVSYALRKKDRRPEMTAFVRQIVATHPKSVRSIDPRNDRTALHMAVTYRTQDSLALTRFLVDNFARLDVTDSSGMTPLHIAYHRKNIECLCLLLGVPNSPVMWKANVRGASIYNKIVTGSDARLLDMMLVGNRQLRTDFTLIQSLLMAKNEALFRHTLETYPEIAAAKGTFGRNILMYAIFDRDVGLDAIDAIIRHGQFDIDAQDDFGNNALHYAASRGDDAIILRLLDAERNSSITPNSVNLLPIDCCLTASKVTLVRMLRANRAVVPTVDTMRRLCNGASSRLIDFITRPATMLERMTEVRRSRFVPRSRHVIG